MKQTQINAPAAPLPAPTGGGSSGRYVQTVHSDVRMPLAASAITGAMIASLGLLIAGLVIYWQRWPLLEMLIPLVLGSLATWLVITLVFWFNERRDIKATWWHAEEVAGQDLDGDNHIGRPEADAMQVRDWRDKMPTRDLEKLRQLRFEEFIAKLYAAERCDTETIRRLGFTEPERAKFVRALREAHPPLIQMARGGNASGWRFLPTDAETCIKFARQRIVWRVMHHSPAADVSGLDTDAP